MRHAHLPHGGSGGRQTRPVLPFLLCPTEAGPESAKRLMPACCDYRLPAQAGPIARALRSVIEPLYQRVCGESSATDWKTEGERLSFDPPQRIYFRTGYWTSDYGSHYTARCSGFLVSVFHFGIVPKMGMHPQIAEQTAIFLAFAHALGVEG